jgi:hypothetical protein
MAIVIIINTNSWVTEAETNSYLEAKIGADSWSALSSTVKKQCIISAYRKIKYLIGMTITEITQAVKDAQMEMSWHLYKYWKDYEKTDTLIASGVKSFNFNGWSETLEKIDVPAFIKNMLQDNYSGGHKFMTVERELN